MFQIPIFDGFLSGKTTTCQVELARMTLFAWHFVLDDSSLVEGHKIYLFQKLHLKIGIVTRVICMAQASREDLQP